MSVNRTDPLVVRSSIMNYVRFRLSFARLLLAVVAFAATLGGMRLLGEASLPLAVVASCAVAGVVLIADVSTGLPTLLAHLFGWITYGLVLGAGIGFALNDLRRGNEWLVLVRTLCPRRQAPLYDCWSYYRYYRRNCARYCQL